MPRIIARLARAQTLRYLPRQQRHGWATDCQLIVDYAEPLLPFWNDFNQLHRRLLRLRGSGDCDSSLFQTAIRATAVGSMTGESGGRSTARARGLGSAVLVLSDLGCNDLTEVRRRQWRHLGARLRRAKCRPVALMPCPPRWWDGELTRLFYPVCWDRAARLPRRFGARG